MLNIELHELLRKQEGSGLELKRDDVRPEKLAREIVALLNLEGGYILLGVEDDGTPVGLTRGNAEEWVMQVCRDHVQPAVIPYWETLPVEGAESRVGVIHLPHDSPDKPYKAKKGSSWVTFVRVGSTTREATREEEARLYQASGLLRYELRIVPGSSFEDLDLQRLSHYFQVVRNQDCPDEEDREGWQRLLINTDLMIEDRGRAIPNIGAILLFGENPRRYLPQAGMTAVAYPGKEKDYASLERATMPLPIVPSEVKTGRAVTGGLIEEAMSFVRRNTAVDAWVDEGGRRHDRWKDYPLEAVRETLVNAVAHRDYSIAGMDIELSIYEDRLEVLSPGRLPNTVTVEKMRYGYRATRNELIKEVLRDYKYIEATGLGIPRKIIDGMRKHNRTEPDLVEMDDRFLVRLKKA